MAKSKLDFPDCGAGIGRITEGLLINKFDKVDLVERDEEFIQKAKEKLEKHPRIGCFYCCDLKQFSFEEKYDCVWVQWVYIGIGKNLNVYLFIRFCHI